MRIYILILAALALGACTLKPVETVYHEEKDFTRFTTKAIITKTGSKEIELVASKECPGKVICTDPVSYKHLTMPTTPYLEFRG